MSGEPAQAATTDGAMTDDALTIDILVQSPLWEHEPEAESTVMRAVSAAANRLSTRGGEVAIVLTDDSAIRTLNRDWRGFDIRDADITRARRVRPRRWSSSNARFSPGSASPILTSRATMPDRDNA